MPTYSVGIGWVNCADCLFWMVSCGAGTAAPSARVEPQAAPPTSWTARGHRRTNLGVAQPDQPHHDCYSHDLESPRQFSSIGARAEVDLLAGVPACWRERLVLYLSGRCQPTSACRYRL